MSSRRASGNLFPLSRRRVSLSFLALSRARASRRSKYTLLSFLPLFLFENFTRFANAYFLMVRSY